MDAGKLTFSEAVRPALLYVTAPISMWKALAMSEALHQQIGRHGAEIETLQREIHEMRAEVRAISSTLSEARGGWKTLMLVAGVAGAVGAGLAKLSMFMGIVK